MNRLRDLSLQRKLTVIIMLTTVAALLLASSAFFAYDLYSTRNDMVQDLGALAETLRANTTNAVVFNDDESAADILGALSVHPHVVSATIFDRNGEVFASYLRADLEADPVPVDEPQTSGHVFRDRHLLLSRDITFSRQQAGTFHIAMDMSEARQRLRSYLQILALVLATVTLLAYFLSYGLQRLVSGPIRNLANTARRVSETRDFATRAPRYAGRDEIGRLVDGFNDMLGQIEARDEELRVARDRAEQANRSKSVFLANMSHELRTPLTAIIGYSEILEDDARELDLSDFLPDLQKIRAAGKHLLGLINSILDLSKVEAGKMELFVERFSVASLIDEVAATARPLIARNQNTLEIDCPDDLGEANSDLTKTRQVLFNLLSNAAKFTEEGRVRLEVRRHRDNGQDFFVYTVRDSGIGMSPEQTGKLFKPFTQADASTARNYGGTGLGLALCKRFCQLMGGRITADSELGKGTVFNVELPADLGSHQAKSVHQLIESGEWQMSHDSADVPADAQLVLVVDDDLAVHELMNDILHKEGFRVATASGGADGIRLARDLRPDIITLDVYMPDRDGWSVLTEIKADPELADIPIIMISVVDHKEKGYALGAEFLTKPIERPRLSALLGKYRGKESTPTALVVDDEPAMRSMLQRMLSEEGWDVIEAEDGIAALRRVAEKQPTLILLDLMMPRLDGFGFVAQLRKNPSWQGIPIVVVTARDLGPEDRDRLNGGVERILQKGAFDIEQLRAEIGSLARGSVRP